MGHYNELKQINQTVKIKIYIDMALIGCIGYTVGKKWRVTLGIGILFMILAALMQAFISATIKSVSSTTPLSLQVAFYYLIPVLYFLPLIFKNGFCTYKPKKFWVHFLRGFFSISAVCCVFYTIKYIPLGLYTNYFKNRELKIF